MNSSNLNSQSAQKVLRAFKARDFSNNVVLQKLQNLINPFETKTKKYKIQPKPDEL